MSVEVEIIMIQRDPQNISLKGSTLKHLQGKMKASRLIMVIQTSSETFFLVFSFASQAQRTDIESGIFPVVMRTGVLLT